MKIEDIHPQLRSAFARIPSMPFHNRLFLKSLNFLSKLIPPPRTTSVQISQRTLGAASLRIYTPEGTPSGAGLLWIHGGGFITGAAKMDEKYCVQYAKELNLVVVSVDYRLAPKHPFPAALDDCFEAWRWFQYQAPAWGIDPTRIVVSGNSAGAGLAASLVQRVFDEGGVQPIAQALFYPMLDDRTAARPDLDAINHRIWNNKSNRAGWSWYLDQPAGATELPQYAVPARREQLAGLPAAWIGTGDIDLFYQENCRYASRLTAAQVSCHMDTVPQAPHAFERIAPDAEISVDFIQQNHNFLRRVLSL